MTGKANAGDAGQDTQRELDGAVLDAEAAEAAERARLEGAAAPAADPAGHTGAAPAGERKVEFTVSEVNVQTLAQIAKAAFGLAAVLTEREHWQLSDAEAEQIATPGAVLVEKYLGDVVIGPEVAFAFALGGSIVMRVALDKQLAKAEAEKAKGGEGAK